jgi:alkylation response protein AidB-like acyl-CoA dehydrogenase
VISFGPTEEQGLVREAVQGFASEVLRPAARAADESEALPEAVLQQAWELGFVATQIPEAFGGAGEARSPVTSALVLEALAFGDAALALAATHPAAFAFAVLDHGSEEQKKRLLPLFCGERFHAASVALLEPTPVFDARALRTTAEPKGDAFVLSGAKSFVPLADRASHFLVLARNTASAAEGVAALDAFVVPRDAVGLTIGAPGKQLGLRALPTATLELERVEVPAADRLGGEAGCDVQRILDASRAGVASLLVGLSCAVMEYAIPYAKDRRAFGEAIAQKQAIAFMLSSMRVETDAMRWLAWKAASHLERGLDATRAAHHARAYAAEHAMKVADDGVQVLGGHGFIREHPVELWYRHARTLSVLEGVASV